MRKRFGSGLRALEDGSCTISVASIKSMIRSDPLLIDKFKNLNRRARVREYIGILEGILRDAPRSALTLSDLACILDLERTYCCRVFREVTGKSFSTWLGEIRIDFAKSLLLAEDKTITDVSGASGFNDLTTFERNFRKMAGISPSAFRRQNQRRRITSTTG